MIDDIAISVKKVSKNFKLPHDKADSVKSLFVNPFNKNRKKFEVQNALKGINFDVKKGEFFGIVGRNGSGKSTLLKIIAGIYQPNVGSVAVNGRLVPFIELGVGFNPELTGRENTYLNGALLGFSEKEVDEKYRAIVDFAELDRFMDQKLKNYSSGMQVRLAFSVATILAESDILLIDEVLAVGDADFQRKCFEYFKKLKKDKKTVVFVSHDMSAVREYCDRAILIDHNEIICSGSAEDVSKEYTKLFLHTHVENNISANQVKASSKWGSGGVDIVDLALSKKVFGAEDKNIEFSYRIVSASGFSDTINPGFTVKDEKGHPICGTNTNISIGKNPKLVFDDKNKTVHISWSFPNIFNQGKYTIDPAVLSSSNGDTLQWWDEAISFQVVNDKSNPYSVAPTVGVKIS
ncbi:MAG: ABC transporter ATP-binding protein [Candidatus Saccharibacteria bacterium]